MSESQEKKYSGCLWEQAKKKQTENHENRTFHRIKLDKKYSLSEQQLFDEIFLMCFKFSLKYNFIWYFICICKKPDKPNINPAINLNRYQHNEVIDNYRLIGDV